MIAHLTGTVTSARGTCIVLDAGGIGYRIFATPETVQEAKSTEGSFSLCTHLAVRENAMDLYGFRTEEELSFFEMLISVSGVGPKSALAVLSIADVKTITDAVRADDHTFLTRVSGIGKKSAERIVLELRDKLGALEAHEHETRTSEDSDVFEALTSLGYSRSQARDALRHVGDDVSGTDARLRQALKHLGS